ncbi:VOC family protein [Streptomyces pristinaespiralis]|uniref:Lactoylglutathione lyase n=2 Tax=Streptomyces pristinaespiralis TaxID=38300 RepID=B5HAM7_STRE2|nr:VOC family protein [Streptomyces pristinaespiralis]ALC25041.1 glyoxalase [Streptomyces pristinaespiralis]EDY63888.2 lactoylglutathione lyase [Streptomyces pristinaespiralis ATCC 25486]QMU12687.1 VOC family protein [Streptomyces pristinaespiralis]
MTQSIADQSLRTPRTLQTGHVGLNVTDLGKSLPFYLRVFGLEVMAEGDEDGRRWAFLARDGRLVLTLWQQSDATFSTSSAGLHHLSFQVDTMEDVEATRAVLLELGADFAHDGVVAHGEGAGSGGIFFADPDGIRLEIYAPTGAEDAPAPAGSAPTCGFF